MRSSLQNMTRFQSSNGYLWKCHRTSTKFLSFMIGFDMFPLQKL